MNVWIVVQESCVDGEILVNVVPCISKEVAKVVLKEQKETILKESYHFSKFSEEEIAEEFEVEESEDSFLIFDPNDTYYEDIKIVEKLVQDK